MKYKKLTKEQIIISLDRLTRFKSTKTKYLRVFLDVLASNLLEPKFKKSELEKLDFSLISNYVTEIFNNSLDCKVCNNFLNNYLKEYENAIFVNDDETQKLLENRIDYSAALELVPEVCPVNLRWFKALKQYLEGVENVDIMYLKDLRREFLLKYPIEVVLIVEGITEETLLPAFSKLLGLDFYAHGIQIIAAGGKNQVVKLYYELSSELRVPIFILLDRDAEDNIAQIKPKLRDCDYIHLVSCGEFEDLLPKQLIVKTVNEHFRNFVSITENDLDKDAPTASVLEEIFKTKGLHEFKKSDFARLVRGKISDESDISPEINTIIDEIKNLNKMLDTKLCS